MHLRVYILPILSNTLCSVKCFRSLALILEIETLTKTVLRAQRKVRSAIGAQGGHVAYATKM